MLDNQFSPVFGGKPQLFFGRQDILRRFDLALVDAGSGDRALFVTGARGSGKTALIEQLSLRATRAGRRVIDLGPEDTLQVLLRALVRHDAETRTLNPQANLTVMGVGGGISAGSVSRTTSFDTSDLQIVLLETCEREKSGLLVTIDEAQKVSEHDMSVICNAFQMASRKGHDVMLVVAGLPYAYDQVIRFQGCTFMRRAAHEQLGLFSRREAHEALQRAFAQIEGVSVGAAALDGLVTASMGHPYLMQLLGYYLVTTLNGRTGSYTSPVTMEEVREATKLALVAYEQRALKPLVEELTTAQKTYLRAIARIIERGDGGNTVKAGQVAEELGRETKQLSVPRDQLIRDGILLAPSRGTLMFAIPYLRAYLVKDAETSDVLARALEWDL